MADKDIFSALAKAASASASGADERVDQAAQAEANSARSIDWARSILSISIIGIYIIAVAAVLIYLGYNATVLSRERAASLTVIDPYSSAMLDVLKVVVLPVVTFMLGFYFGTGSSPLSRQSSRQTRTPPLRRPGG
jgi:hypothetical protein